MLLLCANLRAFDAVAQVAAPADALAPRLVVQTGHSVNVYCAALSPDQKLAATGSQDWNVKLWDVETGLELRTFVGHQTSVESVAFSADGRQIISRDVKQNTLVWDVETGRNLTDVTPVAAPVNMGTLEAQVKNGSAITVERANGRLIQTLGGVVRRVTRAWSAPDDKSLIVSSQHTDTHQATQQRIARWSWPDTSTNAWQLKDGSDKIDLSPNGKWLARSEDDGLSLFDAQTGAQQQFSEIGDIHDISWSPDGKQLSIAAGQNWSIWSAMPLKKLVELDGIPQARRSGLQLVGVPIKETPSPPDAPDAIKAQFVAFSPDGKRVAGATLNEIRIWNAATGALVGRWNKADESPRSIYNELNDGWLVWSGDGSFLATASGRNAQVFDVETRQLVAEWKSPSDICTLSFAPKQHSLIIGMDTGLCLWDVTQPQPSALVEAGENFVTSLAWFQGGKILASSTFDGTIKFWRVGSDLKELGTFVSMENGDWAFSDPQGRYDASNGGDIAGIHWVVGTTPLELKQLKQRFYVPNLLAKIMDGEALPPVTGLDHVELPPTVEVAPQLQGANRLALHLQDQGGGLGRVQVFVNGNEWTPDARAEGGVKGDPTRLSVNLSGAPLLPGQTNEVKVVAWNREGYISSRGIKLEWQAPVADDAPPPQLWAIVVGTSSFANSALNLRFAAKDAEDFARAIKVAGAGLFGVQGVHVSLLASDGAPVVAPSRANIENAFRQTATLAKPGDVLLVYFSGHGIAPNNGSDGYFYLTQDARSTDSKTLADPAVRALSTISSEDLANWMSGKEGIKALKQILILDTCAAGAAAEKWSDKKAVSGDQIRALETLKDRTGFHILMGCTADAVSYEASRYNQGVLTYALLEYMRADGAPDGAQVDVSRLFRYAAEQVPLLANNIGHTQRPQIKAPVGADSFAFGRLEAADRAAIPIAGRATLLLRPVLLNAAKLRDDLGLSTLVRAGLREATFASARGAQMPRFVDAEAGDLSGALTPSGTYRVDGETVRVEIVLADGDREVARFNIEGEVKAPEALAGKIVEAILAVKLR